MPVPTDPARELAEVCERLARAPDNVRGDDHLAQAFDVKPWSPEFYQIVFCIVDRCKMLSNLISEIDGDEDIKGEATRHLDSISLAFNRNSVVNVWNSAGAANLGREHTQAIKMLSPVVRKIVSYPKLDEDEIGELVALIDELEKWLLDHQLAEQDFIRQAIIDGLKTVRFRLQRVGWLGWGYTVASVRDVIGAYLALQNGLPPDGSAPDAEALLKKVSSFLRSFYQKAGLVKETIEMGEFLLKAYGAATLTYQGAGVAGLLTFVSGN